MIEEEMRTLLEEILRWSVDLDRRILSVLQKGKGTKIEIKESTE